MLLAPTSTASTQLCISLTWQRAVLPCLPALCADILGRLPHTPPALQSVPGALPAAAGSGRKRGVGAHRAREPATAERRRCGCWTAACLCCGCRCCDRHAAPCRCWAMHCDSMPVPARPALSPIAAVRGIAPRLQPKLRMDKTWLSRLVPLQPHPNFPLHRLPFTGGRCTATPSAWPSRRWGCGPGCCACRWVCGCQCVTVAVWMSLRAA